MPDSTNSETERERGFDANAILEERKSKPSIVVYLIAGVLGATGCLVLSGSFMSLATELTRPPVSAPGFR